MAFVISHKYKFVYVHIPKTGGTSFATIKDEAVDKPGFFNQHAGPDDVLLTHQHITHANEPYYKWAVIRNPHERLVSLYEWDRLVGKNKNRSFDWFINKVSHHLDLFYEGRGGMWLWWPQWYWITESVKNMAPKDWPDKILTDECLLFDNLVENVQHLLKRLGCPTNGHFPHNRNGGIRDYMAYYSRSQLETVKRLYRKDFELYVSLRD